MRSSRSVIKLILVSTISLTAVQSHGVGYGLFWGSVKSEDASSEARLLLFLGSMTATTAGLISLFFQPMLGVGLLLDDSSGASVQVSDIANSAIAYGANREEANNLAILINNSQPNSNLSAANLAKQLHTAAPHFYEQGNLLLWLENQYYRQQSMTN